MIQRYTQIRKVRFFYSWVAEKDTRRFHNESTVVAQYQERLQLTYEWDRSWCAALRTTGVELLLCPAGSRHAAPENSTVLVTQLFPQAYHNRRPHVIIK